MHIIRKSVWVLIVLLVLDVALKLNIDSIISLFLPEVGTTKSYALQKDYLEHKLIYTVLLKNIIPILAALLIAITAVILLAKKKFIIDINIRPNWGVKLVRSRTVIFLAIVLCLSLFAAGVYVYQIQYAIAWSQQA